MCVCHDAKLTLSLSLWISGSVAELPGTCNPGQGEVEAGRHPYHPPDPYSESFGRDLVESALFDDADRASASNVNELFFFSGQHYLSNQMNFKMQEMSE